MARRGVAGYGEARQVWHGPVRSDKVRQAGLGKVRYVEAGQGNEWQGRQGSEWRVEDRQARRDEV